MKNFFTLVLLSCLPFVGYGMPGVVPDALKQAIKSNNAQEVAKYFNNAIELDILGKDDVYNKARAEQLISAFFTQYPVINFSILFEGGKDSNQYAIGKLTTSKGIFRVSILLKGSAILQFRVEEDNGN
jgi:hypothetical protein